jgi:hypothetical protein
MELIRHYVKGTNSFSEHTIIAEFRGYVKVCGTFGVGLGTSIKNADNGLMLRQVIWGWLS